MYEKRLLITAFEGTSSEWLIKCINEYDTLTLPNHKLKDTELLIKAITQKRYDYIISFGQRPSIKNKINIELMARKGEVNITTIFDCEKLKCLCEQEDIEVKISYNAGTSFCNELYFNGLDYIHKCGLAIKMVFIHIPFMKNIKDENVFADRMCRVLQAIVRE